MIIFRYLSSQVLLSTMAVSTVLTLIIFSGRLIKFVAQAAAGELAPEFVVLLVLYRIPGMLVLILPLGLFLGVLLAYGRMHLQSEMVVLRSAGISLRRLSAISLGPAAVVAGLIALLSFYISPLCWQQIDHLYYQQAQKSELEGLASGRFQKLGSNRTAYTGTVHEQSGQIDLIFISERDEASGQLRVVLAESGKQVMTDAKGEQRFVVLRNGYRYDGVPGEPAYREAAFAQYGFALPDIVAEKPRYDVEALPMQELFNASNRWQQAELNWRLSMPLLALIVTLIAVPLSKTNPRQGRYAKMIPAILLYLAYLALLTGAKGAVIDGQLSVGWIWLIHGVFFLIALSLVLAEPVWLRLLAKLPSLPGRSA